MNMNTDDFTVYVGKGSDIVAAKIIIEFDEGLLPVESVSKLLDLWAEHCANAVAQYLNTLPDQ